MRFKGMGRHAVVIAPNFLEQNVARDGLGTLPIKVLKDRCFLVSQSNLVAIIGF